MILIDLNQVMISNLMMQPGIVNSVDENLIRHMVLNSLRSYNVKFKDEYGEIVVCSDDRKYWRKDMFPYYKASRKKDRAESPYDWNMIFETLNRVREELKECFPYRVVQVDKTEADDIIGTICHKFGVELMNATTEKILILSSDKDFMQLQKFANVEQYSPMAKKFLRSDNPSNFLREHIIKGDRGDGIPNILSQDDTFVQEIRQKPVSEKKLNSWLTQKPEDFCDERMLRNFKRNEPLIDLSKIPNDVQAQIMEAFETAPKNGRDKLFNYFIKNRMKQMMVHLGEF
jgi:5'-3' exonuclease, N-terminal resolvase-like domain/T4 RNase H, C terminal